MRAIEDDLIYRDECYQIVGCCMEVHKQLGCGFKEATDIHQAQVFNYLKASKLRLGLLVNFGTTSLQFKRFII